jgi:DNA-binding CsgD family transcriptional regulator
MPVWEKLRPGAEPQSIDLALLLVSTAKWKCLADSLRLSPREVQVVKGVFRDNKEESIAADLGISPHTVGTYLQRIYTKLRVNSRPQLIVRVMAEYLYMPCHGPQESAVERANDS